MPYLCSMKKRTILSSAIVMGIALVALLCLQTLYFNEVLDICTEQFDIQTQRSLHRVARETSTALKALPGYEELTIDERINGRNIDKRLRTLLDENGVDIPYHFRIVSADGRQIYACSDYEPAGRAKEYPQQLFRESPKAQMAMLYVHFPERRKFILESVHYMVPVVVLILIVVVLFIFIFSESMRQRRLAEEKNDFINNMTHELKTPISTISLAAQMLADKSMPKTESSLEHLSGVVVDETKRLRFLVDKVLQMSLFDQGRKTSFKLKEIDLHELITDVVSTFRIKVEKNGGSLTADLQAANPVVMADELHLTNVVFNLLDNAVKYRDAERALKLTVKTVSDARHLTITIADNGIGISTDNLKRIFEKFYRVSTGNRHDVKGFGLGLAYVRSVIKTLGGTIHAESQQGKGTSFVIRLPLSEETLIHKS